MSTTTALLTIAALLNYGIWHWILSKNISVIQNCFGHRTAESKPIPGRQAVAPDWQQHHSRGTQQAGDAYPTTLCTWRSPGLVHLHSPVPSPCFAVPLHTHFPNQIFISMCSSNTVYKTTLPAAHVHPTSSYTESGWQTWLRVFAVSQTGDLTQPKKKTRGRSQGCFSQQQSWLKVHTKPQLQGADPEQFKFI